MRLRASASQTLTRPSPEQPRTEPRRSRERSSTIHRARISKAGRTAVELPWAESMNRIVIGFGVAAALSLPAAAPAQVAEAPVPAQPSASSAAQAMPYAPPPSPAAPAARIEMPSPPAPAESQAAARPEPRPPHRRTHAKHRALPSRVDRSAANYFTHQLNRGELESLGSGGDAPQADAPRAPWRDVYPPE